MYLKFLQLLTETKGQTARYNSVLGAFKTTLREEGIFALWKGHVPAQCLSMIYGGMQVSDIFYHILTKPRYSKLLLFSEILY